MTVTTPAVGLMLPTVANIDTGKIDPSRLLEAARRAEAGGFDGAYVGDHLLHPHPILESVVSLSMVAASTVRISFGPCVMLVGLRDPLVLAKQLGSLAAFAPGRLRVGFGVGGEYPAEFEVAGVPLGQRGQRMESNLRQVRRLLTTGLDHPDATFSPRAPNVPFLLGGWKEVSMRRAAALGEGWIGYLLGPDGFARRRAFLHDCREQLGRSDEPFITGMLVPVHIGEPDRAHGRAAAAWAALTGSKEAPPDRLFAAGDPDAVVEQLHRYHQLGCTEFMLAPADQGDGYLHQVDVLSNEVLPRIRAFS